MRSRRDFLATTAGAGLVGALGEWGPFARLGLLAAAEADVDPGIVQFTPDIEPVVRLIEETPREKCFEMMVEQLRRGLPYRHFLAALFLAGTRNVSPQPPGFKFHCVFAIHAAHQLSLDAPVGERLLPLFWALDYFKGSQAQDVKEGDFVLKRVKGPLPSPETAWDEFHTAMDDWDEERADRAIAALVRSRGAHEIIEGLWRYGSRDYRNIGHKAIFVANSWRTLETIGWRHAEPALRSLVLGLLDFGKNERVNNYAFEDQAYLSNLQRAQEAAPKLPPNWTAVEENSGVTLGLLEIIRSGDMQQSCDAAVAQLMGGHARAQAVWDAVHLAADELMMRQPGIYGIHTVTSVNGLRYAFQTSANPETRLLLLLQGVGWMCQFKNFMAVARGGLKPVRITELTGEKSPDDPREAAEEVLALLSSDAPAAAARALAFAEKNPEPQIFTQAARQLIFRKGTDAHHYKYAAAIFEDYRLVSRRWRPQMLATSIYFLKGSRHPDSPVMQRAQQAVRTL